MALMGHLDKLLEPTATALGYELVRVSLLGSGRATLQVMAERLDEAPMTVADCEALSRALSAVLDVEDPISGEYLLEVSSPGLDRPLTRPKDFDRFKGREARIETDRMIEGQRRFKGEIIGIDPDKTVRLRVNDAPEGVDPDRAIPFGAITKAKLLLTEAVIAESLRAAKAAQAELADDEPEAESED